MLPPKLGKKVLSAAPTIPPATVPTPGTTEPIAAPVAPDASEGNIMPIASPKPPGSCLNNSLVPSMPPLSHAFSMSAKLNLILGLAA